MNAEVVGIVASAIFIIRLVPQPLALAQTGVLAGVSPLAALNSTTSALAWLVYGIDARLPIIWIVSLVALVPGFWTNALLVPRTTRRDLGWWSLWVLALVGAWLLGEFDGALAMGVVVTQGPQVVRAVRETDLSGLTPSTWWVSLLDAASWGAYGWLLGDQALIGYFVTLTVCSLIVLLRLRATRTTNDGDVTPLIEEFT